MPEPGSQGAPPHPHPTSHCTRGFPLRRGASLPPKGEEAVQPPAQSAVRQLQDHPSDHLTAGGGGAKQGLRPPSAFPIRALCHLALKQYKEAVRDCTEALRLDGKNVKAFYRRAQAYKALKVRKA